MADPIQDQLNHDQKQKNTHYERAITILEEHARVANNEMGLIQKSMAVMENDINWIKRELGDWRSGVSQMESSIIDKISAKIEVKKQKLPGWVTYIAIPLLISLLLFYLENKR